MITQIENLIPATDRVYLLLGLGLLPYLTRGLHAWLNKGDLRSIIGAIFFGTNTPAPDSQAQMKLPLSLILALLVPCSLLLCVGCHTTPQQASFQAAGTTTVTVDVAMSEWGAYVAAAHPLATQEQAVKDAFGRYQTAMAAVCDAGAIYAGSASTNSTAAGGALQTAIANAGNEIADLENLITSFGVTLK